MNNSKGYNRFAKTSSTKVYNYYRSQADNFYAFAKKREKFLKPILKKIKPKKILELGCGDGSLGQIIEDLTGSQVFGVDYSLTGLKIAQKRGIITKKADLNKSIPFNSNYFDLVISDQLIEHINNTDLLVRESYRVLKKRGYLITITPNLSYWFNRVLFFLGIYPIFLEVSLNIKTMGQGVIKKYMLREKSMGHIRVFNLPALIDLLTYWGFIVEKKQGIPLAFSSSSWFSYIYNIIDIVFAKKTSLARDLMVIAKKN